MLSNGIEYNVSHGTLCLISPFIFTEIVSSSDDCKWEMICDDKSIFNPYAKYVLGKIRTSDLFKNSCLKLDKKQIEEFMFFVDKIKDKQRMLDNELNKDDIVILRQNIIALEVAAEFEFLSLYFKDKPLSLRKENDYETIALNFINSLNQNYATHRDVDWYAAQANLSTIYFTKIVRQHIGYTPNVLIKHILVANAKKMLSQSELSIKEISAKLNFSSQLTFSRFFKSCTGMSPKEYRKTGGVCC